MEYTILSTKTEKLKKEIHNTFSKTCNQLDSILIIEDGNQVIIDYIDQWSGRLIETDCVSISPDEKIIVNDHELGVNISITIDTIPDFYQKIDLIAVIQSHLKK